MKMWLLPWPTYAAIAGMVIVIVSMAFVEHVRSQLILGGVTRHVLENSDMPVLMCR